MTVSTVESLGSRASVAVISARLNHAAHAAHAHEYDGLAESLTDLAHILGSMPTAVSSDVAAALLGAVASAPLRVARYAFTADLAEE